MTTNCNCNYSATTNTPCVSCVNVANSANKQNMTQKRIWGQVRAGSGMYTMNLSALTAGAAILASGSTTNWNQMSDRVLAATQPPLRPTHGNSLRSTLTSDRPGAGSPGGSGVDVKHDSYARYLNRKKASTMKTQTTQTASVAISGNKTNAVGLLSNSINCCT
jgi:hypothetical protein